MILEADVERAVTFLRESATKAAQARANVRYLETHLKVIIATLKAHSKATSNAAALDEAMSSETYKTALDGYRVAVEVDSEFTFKREAASSLISAWQSMTKMQLAEGRAYQ